MWGGRQLLASRFSASRAAAGVLEVLALLRETNTLMGMKSLALASARPRIYSDLRAAASLGGYHFNWSRLEGHLEISDQAISADLADSSWHLALSLPPPHLPLISIRWPHIHPAPPVICL